MRHVILQIDITLDGFVAGPNDDTSWVKSDEEMNQDANMLLDTVDTILLGRVAYQQFITFWPFADVSGANTISQIAYKLNHANKLIFSRTLDKVEWGTWNNAKLVKGNIVEEITAMKAQSGKNLLLYAGAEIISTFIHLGLIDEYRLRIHPVVVGGGKPIFKDIGDSMNLKLVDTKSYKNGAVLLDYRNN